MEQNPAIRGRPCPRSDPDADLIRRAQAGDPAALEALLEPYWASVYRLAYRVTGHVQDAEDLAQDAFVRILRRLPAFRGECRIGAWIYRVALNVCLTARARRPARSLDIDASPPADPRPGPETVALRREAQEVVSREIRRLRPAYREAILLRLVEDLPYEEIAEILGVSVNTVRLRVHRGIDQLRKRLRPLAGEERPLAGEERPLAGEEGQL